MPAPTGRCAVSNGTKTIKPLKCRFSDNILFLYRRKAVVSMFYCRRHNLILNSSFVTSPCAKDGAVRPINVGQKEFILFFLKQNTIFAEMSHSVKGWRRFCGCDKGTRSVPATAKMWRSKTPQRADSPTGVLRSPSRRKAAKR